MEHLAQDAVAVEGGRVEIVLGKRPEKWPEKQERVGQRRVSARTIRMTESSIGGTSR